MKRLIALSILLLAGPSLAAAQVENVNISITSGFMTVGRGDPLFPPHWASMVLVPVFPVVEP